MDLQLSGQGRGPRWISQHTPTGDNGWRKRQTRLGLGNAAEYSATIRSFINMPAISLVSGPTASRTWGPEHGEDPSPAIMTLAKNFSKYTERSSQSAALQRACASFQRLILLSLCLILREKGSSVEEIDRIISWLSPVERVRHDCLKGAKWVNEAILALHLRQGWSLQRATELFFLGRDCSPGNARMLKKSRLMHACAAEMRSLRVDLRDCSRRMAIGDC